MRDKDPLCLDSEYDDFQIFVSAEWIPSWITLQIYRKRFGIFMKCVWALLLLTSFIICRDLIKGNHYYFDLYKKKTGWRTLIDLGSNLHLFMKILSPFPIIKIQSDFAGLHELFMDQSIVY